MEEEGEIGTLMISQITNISKLTKKAGLFYFLLFLVD
jgi:hypothetical protein